MSTKINSASIAALVVLVLTAPAAPVPAQTPVASTGATELKVQVGSPASRGRGLDREARRVLEQAAAASSTVARLVTELERSDLIVGIQLCPLPRKLSGEMRTVTATPEVRHVRIRVNSPNAVPALIAVLGHELRHATELAAAPEVRDTDAQARLFRRIGYERYSGGYFETEAALEVGRMVAAEISRSPVK
jgi:hypothetical protein